MSGLSLISALALAIAPVPPVPTAEPAPPTAPAETVSQPERTPGDPLEGVNRFMFRVFRGLDKAVLRPVALGYKQIVPRPLRTGIRHVLSNLGEPVVFLNDMLQLRPARALRTFGRFAINTTLGVGGLIDVATPENLPHRPNGFGNTLGYYGVKPGPYLFIPILGPSTLRDLAGGTGDGLVLPTVVGSPFDRTDYRIATAVVGGLDTRAERDAELTTLYETSLDPYATLRSVYLQSRAAEIAALKEKGRNLPGSATAPDETLADPLADPAPDGASPPPGDTASPADPLADPVPAEAVPATELPPAG